MSRRGKHHVHVPPLDISAAQEAREHPWANMDWPMFFAKFYDNDIGNNLRMLYFHQKKMRSKVRGKIFCIVTSCSSRRGNNRSCLFNVCLSAVVEITHLPYMSFGQVLKKNYTFLSSPDGMCRGRGWLIMQMRLIADAVDRHLIFMVMLVIF